MTWLSVLGSLALRNRQSKRKPAWLNAKLALEALEERALLSSNALGYDLARNIHVAGAFRDSLPSQTATSDLKSPSGRLDLSHWNLTLPTGTAHHPVVISTSSLLAGYSSQYFYTGKDGAINFWVPVTGVSTRGSRFPRSELRETRRDGSLYNWNVKDGTAALNATLAVQAVPSTGKVVIGQIHDNGAHHVRNEPLLKLVYEYDASRGTGRLVAQVRPTPHSHGSKDYTVATNVKLGAQFSYQMQLQPDLTLSVQVNGVTAYSASIDAGWQTQGLYFKAGAYVQDHVGPSTEGAHVAFYALTVSHR
jgi:Alginate lyase